MGLAITDTGGRDTDLCGSVRDIFKGERARSAHSTRMIKAPDPWPE
jgi:hypothetical protein